jgi:outer membrane protein assembly factor BamD (BamD/ComL family)
VTQSFSQLSQALQSGNLTAAQKDYSNIQQDFQTRGTQGAHGHHHRHGGGGSEEDQNQVSQTFAQLGQELQTGDLSGSQQAYSSLQQEMQSLTPNGAAPSAEGTAIGSVSVTV